MKGWINLYESGFWHPAGRPGTLDIHAGDVYLSRDAALKSINPRSHWISTVPVEFTLPEERVERCAEAVRRAREGDCPEERRKGDPWGTGTGCK